MFSFFDTYDFDQSNSKNIQSQAITWFNTFNRFNSDQYRKIKYSTWQPRTKNGVIRKLLNIYKKLIDKEKIYILFNFDTFLQKKIIRITNLRRLQNLNTLIKMLLTLGITSF
jgi:hypothetical protein